MYIFCILSELSAASVESIFSVYSLSCLPHLWRATTTLMDFSSPCRLAPRDTSDIPPLAFKARSRIESIRQRDIDAGSNPNPNPTLTLIDYTHNYPNSNSKSPFPSPQVCNCQALGEEVMAKGAWKDLAQFLAEESFRGMRIYPNFSQVFPALELCPFNKGRNETKALTHK
ncbi:hypothetical protein AAMO2058_000054000 [Amorphochlora amoebiformis]